MLLKSIQESSNDFVKTTLSDAVGLHIYILAI